MSLFTESSNQDLPSSPQPVRIPSEAIGPQADACPPEDASPNGNSLKNGSTESGRSEATAPEVDAAQPASILPASIDQASGEESQAVADADASPLLFAEDLAVGDCWETEFREISEGDVQAFSDLTGDHTALHGDAAARSPYGRPVAHGLLGLSVLAGLGTHHPKVSTLALVGLEQWEFLAPIFFGDQVRAKNTIVELTQHGRRAVKVRWSRELLSESGKVLQRGFFVTLVGSRVRGRSKPR